jgi:uncharacterized protein involved in response to NO
MLFGFTTAVIAGFLFTAVRNWTGQPTPSGALLAALGALWVAGRVLVLTPLTVVSASANAAFPIAVAIAIAVPLARSGNRRNYFFVALLTMLGIAELGLHAALLGWIGLPARLTLQSGLDVVLFIIAVMAGRVIPMFTNNGVPGAGAVRNQWVERAALGSTLLLLAADIAQLPPLALASIAVLAALAHGARLWLWRPWRTTRAPLVWILHAAYAWVIVHLALRTLAAFGAVPEPLALHALTIGTIGGMTIGMMTRTARGHTGRPLIADASEVARFGAVQLTAVIRVAGGALLPDRYLWTIVLAGICWSGGFGLYAVRYWPILTRPRIDGKPG